MSIRIATAAAFAALTLAAVSAHAQHAYQLDPAHTTVGFKVRHLMVSDVKGSFDQVEGTLNFDPAKVENSSVNITIQATSVNTRNAKRDDDLRGASYLDVAKFPTITFVSKKVAKSGDGMTVTGDLTIHGVTKEVSIPFTMSGPLKTPWGSSVIGVSGSLQINRKDFGITKVTPIESGGVVVGDEVKIEIDAEFGMKA